MPDGDAFHHFSCIRKEADSAKVFPIGHLNWLPSVGEKIPESGDIPFYGCSRCFLLQKTGSREGRGTLRDFVHPPPTLISRETSAAHD